MGLVRRFRRLGPPAPAMDAQPWQNRWKTEPAKLSRTHNSSDILASTLARAPHSDEGVRYLNCTSRPSTGDFKTAADIWSSDLHARGVSFSVRGGPGVCLGQDKCQRFPHDLVRGHLLLSTPRESVLRAAFSKTAERGCWRKPNESCVAPLGGRGMGTMRCGIVTLG